MYYVRQNISDELEIANSETDEVYPVTPKSLKNHEILGVDLNKGHNSSEFNLTPVHLLVKESLENDFKVNIIDSSNTRYIWIDASTSHQRSIEGVVANFVCSMKMVKIKNSVRNILMIDTHNPRNVVSIYTLMKYRSINKNS